MNASARAPPPGPNGKGGICSCVVFLAVPFSCPHPPIFQAGCVSPCWSLPQTSYTGLWEQGLRWEGLLSSGICPPGVSTMGQGRRPQMTEQGLDGGQRRPNAEASSPAMRGSASRTEGLGATRTSHHNQIRRGPSCPVVSPPTSTPPDPEAETARPTLGQHSQWGQTGLGHLLLGLIHDKQVTRRSWDPTQRTHRGSRSTSNPPELVLPKAFSMKVLFSSKELS